MDTFASFMLARECAADAIDSVVELLKVHLGGLELVACVCV